MIPAHISQVGFELIDENDAAAWQKFELWVELEIASKLPNAAKLISLDGWDGAGKSTLGRALAKSLKCPFVDLDDHLEKNQGYYLNALNFSEVTKRIETGLKTSARVVVSGCLMDSALERSGFRSEFRIYVMRVSGMISNPDVEFIDEFESLYDDISADELIAKEEEIARRFADFNGDPLAETESALPLLQVELISYHKKEHPHDSADMIVKITRRA